MARQHLEVPRLCSQRAVTPAEENISVFSGNILELSLVLGNITTPGAKRTHKQTKNTDPGWGKKSEELLGAQWGMDARQMRMTALIMVTTRTFTGTTEQLVGSRVKC